MGITCWGFQWLWMASKNPEHTWGLLVVYYCFEWCPSEGRQKVCHDINNSDMRSKIHHNIKMCVMASKIRHEVKKVLHEVKNFVMRSTISSGRRKVRNDVKNMAWRGQACHNFKYGMTSLTSKRSAKHTIITSLDVQCTLYVYSWLAWSLAHSLPFDFGLMTCSWCHGTLFHSMTYFWRYDERCDVMTNFWRYEVYFAVMTHLLPHDAFVMS